MGDVLQQNNKMASDIYKIGIDVGSTTAKIVILDQAYRVVFSEYTRHNAEIDQTILSILNKVYTFRDDINLRLNITGSAGMGLSEICHFPFVQEVVASAQVVQEFYPSAKMLIDVGGEDTKMIFFDDQMRPDIRMNGNCAGGTGAFIDQMAALLEISVAELDKFAQSHTCIYPIASRCGVFAKTDVQNLLSNHTPVDDIAASIFHAVALQTINTLARGYDIQPKVLFCGGPLSFLKNLRESFVEVLHIENDQVIFPQRPELLPAVGAAISEDDKFEISLKDLITLIEEKTKRKKLIPNQYLKPLFTTNDEFQEWLDKKLSDKVEKTDLKNLNNKETFLGIDAGSTTTKIVLTDNLGRVAFTYYGNNQGKHIESVKNGLDQLRQKIESENLNIKIKRTAVTGYGEGLIKSAFNIDDGIVETLAHYQAAKSFDKDVSFILDIGGQDMKAIFVKDGVINNIQINEACSSGCGSFIETFARSMNYNVMDFAHIACDAYFPRDLGTRCTVFMNSKVKQILREGSSVGDISAGLAYSVLKNCFNKVLKIHDKEVLGDNIVVQGGTFKNLAVLRAMELYIDKEVTRPDICELMGAYGAALSAIDRAQKNGQTDTRFIGLENINNVTNYQKKTVNCKGCENQCRLTRLNFTTGEKFYSGNRCEKIFTNNGDTQTRGNNLYEIKNSLLFDRKKNPINPSIAAIGIPRVLNMYENFPFWCTLFVESGFKVELSSPSTTDILEKGSGSIMSDNICFPAKLAHGHIIDLLEKKVDRIFYPIVNYEERQFNKSTNSYNCPIVTGYPDVIRSAINPEKYNIPFDTPTVVFNKNKLLRKSCYEYLQQFGVSGKVFSRAFYLALKSNASFKLSLRKKGLEILQESEKTGKLVIMLAGRPYHSDPLINHKIPEVISQFGVDVITEDVVPLDELEDFRDLSVLSQWEYSNRLYGAAKWVGKKDNIHFLQLNSFGCGPDALTVDEVRDILKQYGKISTFLRIDEITSIGSVKLRIRSLVESLKLEQNKKSRTFQKRKTTPLFVKSDREKTIIGPNFSPFYSLFVENLLKPMGYKLEILPDPDRESVELGLKYTNNDICYPAIICVGDVLKALRSGKYDLNNTAVAISETGGQCRASNYVSLMKKALINSGYDNIPVVTLTTGWNSLNKQPGLKMNRKQIITIALSGLLYIDSLLKLYYASAAREKRKGDALKITQKYLHKAKQQIGSYKIKNASGLLRQAVEEFNEIETVNRDLPKVGIVGEIYVKYNPFANNNLCDWLMDEGVEVFVPPLLMFFITSLVDNDINRNSNILKEGILSHGFSHLMESFLNGKIDKYNSIVNHFRHDIAPIHHIRTIAEKAKNVLNLVNQFGEGWMIAGEVVAMAETGINNVVCLQPFACIANHIVAKGISKRLKDLYPDLNMLFIDMDPGGSEVNIHNRLKFLLKNAKDMQVKKTKVIIENDNAESVFSETKKAKALVFEDNLLN